MANESKGSGASDGFGTRGSDDSDFGALTGGDSGLGNLPPLSDFESSAGGGGFDSGLPPLSAIDPSSDKDRISIGGLPPISDIPVETPIPTGGAIRPPSSPGDNSSARESRNACRCSGFSKDQYCRTSRTGSVRSNSGFTCMSSS